MIEVYDIYWLIVDLVGLLDDVGVEWVVWVGYDWGVVVVWNVLLLYVD